MRVVWFDHNIASGLRDAPRRQNPEITSGAVARATEATAACAHALREGLVTKAVVCGAFLRVFDEALNERDRDKTFTVGYRPDFVNGP